MKWLDKFNNGGVQPNYNNSNVSLPPNFKGYGYNNIGNSKNASWDGPVTKMGGTVPGASGMMYARTSGIEPKKAQKGTSKSKVDLASSYFPATKEKLFLPDQDNKQIEIDDQRENYIEEIGVLRNIENGKIDFNKAVNIKDSKEAQAFINRYNDPVTRQKLIDQTGLSNKDIDNIIIRGLKANKTLVDKLEKPDSLAETWVNPMSGEDEMFFKSSVYKNPNVDLHERLHASKLDDLMGGVLQKVLGDATKQKRKDKSIYIPTETKNYLNRPGEAYGNFAEFREELGIKPGEKIDVKKLRKLVKEKNIQSNFYNVFEDDKIVEALNTIAFNDNLPIQNTAQRGKTIPFKDLENPLVNTKSLIEQYSPISEKKGIDNDLLLRQAWKESSFRPNIKNKLGYIGLAQVGNDVIEDYKKANKVNNVNPYNPSDAKKIQEWYMNNLYNSSFANKSNQSEEVRKAKALAAYNYGRGKVVELLNSAKSEGMDIYNSLDWLKKLPKETRDYTNKILGKDKDFNKEYDSISKLPKYQNIINTYNPYPIKLQDGDTVSKEDERRILDYIQLMNMQTKPKGSIRASDTKQTKLSKVKEVALNPLTAMSYIAQNKDIPDNFSRGPRNTLDYALDVINPAQYVEDSKNVVQGSYEGNLGQVGEGLLGVVPMMIEAKNIVKGVDRLGNKYLPNAYKYNPYAFKANPEAYYRGIGREGMEDALQSGVFRARATRPSGVPDASGIRLKGKGFGDVYFSPEFEVADRYGKGFIGEVPKNSANWKILDSPRHASGWSQFSETPIPIEQGRILQKDWLKGYKEIPKPNTTSSLDDVRINKDSQLKISNVGKTNVLGEVVNRSITPIGYDPFTVLASPAELLTPNFLKFKPKTHATKNRLDAWRLYNGLEPNYNTFSKNADNTLSINDFRIEKDKLQSIVDNPKSSFGTMEIEPEFNFGGVHGNGLIIKGVDEQGRKFIDFTDTWDLQPFQSIKGLPKKLKEFEVSSLTGGQPFDLKNRIYYDDAGNFFDHNNNKLIEKVESFSKGVIKENEPADVVMLTTPKIADEKQMDVLKDWNNAQNQKYIKGAGVGAVGTLGGLNYINSKLNKKSKEEAPQYKKGGVIKDNNGYWNPDNWGKPVEINSNRITMKGVNQPLLGISDIGDTKLMKPGKNYKFKGKKVTEFPMAKNGLRQEQKGLVNLDQLTNFTNYNTKQPGGWLDKY
jgi:soluble lytic murein transglycosylase-like protein